MEHAQVVHLVGNIVVDDDARVSVHGDLDVVGGRLAAPAAAHRPRIQLAFYDEASIVLVEVGGQAVELGATLPQRRERLRGGLAVIAMIDRVRLVKLGEVARDLGVDLLSFLGDSTLIEHSESTGRGTNL